MFIFSGRHIVGLGPILSCLALFIGPRNTFYVVVASAKALAAVTTMVH